MSEEVIEKPIAKMGKVERVNFVAPQQQEEEDENNELSEDEQANIAKGLNADGTSKAAVSTALTEDQKKANIAAGLNEDGTSKAPVLTDEIKAANVAKGLNEDGSAKVTVLTDAEKQANISKGLNEDGTAKTPVLDDAAVLAYLKSKGKDVKSLDELTTPTTTLTPEQKKAAENALDKKRLDWFVANGGTVDSYSKMKELATSDLTALSEKKLEQELTDAKFTEEEKKIIRAERYYQLDEEAIEALEDETEKSLAKKKKEFGTQKLNSKAAHEQKLAVSFFDNIDKALKEQDTVAADEKELTQKVDSHFQTVSGKITLELGKTPDGKVIAPIEVDVPAEIIAEVKEQLRNTETRNKILQTEDGTLNIAALSEILIRNKVLEAAANRSYLKGVSDNTAEFEKIFPIKDANAIGLSSLNGGNNGQGKGKQKQPASFGKPTRVNMPIPTT